MRVNFDKTDLSKFKELLNIKDKNINIADMLLTAFNYCDFLNPEYMKTSLNEEQDIKEILVDSFKDDPDSKDIPNHIEIKCLNPENFYNDFVNKLSNKTCSFKNYKLKILSYEPYQLFAYDDIKVTNDFDEVSRIGYFKEKFSYLALAEGKNIWMSVNPNEINTMKPFIKDAKGNVLVLGLGMGYITYMLSKKDNIKSITVVEKNRDNIILFKKYIAPIFENLKKVKIIEADAIDFVKHNSHYDYIFADLWFNPEDGLEYYLDLHEIEKQKKIKIHYWLQESILQMKRRYLLELINESISGFDESNYLSEETSCDRIFKKLFNQTKNIALNSINDVRRLLNEVN